MARRREVPYSPVDPAPAGIRVGVTAARTEMEALMLAPPHAPIEWSVERLLPLRDVLEDAIEGALTERERWIFNACVVERKSIRQVGKDLSLAKSYVDRIKQEAVRKLRDALDGHPLIEGFLNR